MLLRINLTPALLRTATPSGFLLLSPGNVTALDARDGAVRWRFEAGAAVRTTPAVSAAGVVYVGTVDGTLHALSVADGNATGRHWAYKARDYDGMGALPIHHPK